VIDTHTAVAAHVYREYRKSTGDSLETVIASTASPYKFTRSVVEALDETCKGEEDFALIEKLSRLSNTPVPKAVEELKTAPVLHNKVCEVAKMQQTVEEILEKNRA
jgi:threonine synthase